MKPFVTVHIVLDILLRTDISQLHQLLPHILNLVAPKQHLVYLELRDHHAVRVCTLEFLAGLQTAETLAEALIVLAEQQQHRALVHEELHKFRVKID